MIHVAKTHRTVVRNSAYRKSECGIRERHNERKNEVYSNPDIVLERSGLNVHFKRSEGTYAQMLDVLEKEKAISMRGLKKDAKVFDEMVFDVNSAYFDEQGGYEYAKEFFKAAYDMAVKEAGDERYILSAVMHADEKNRALSEELGRDVFHYHLHVTYVPVVEKEIRWSKRCKDEHLRGTVKEVIHQVSHSKKWASEKAKDANGNEIRENGKAVLIPSYGRLQDRFHEHMKAAGFEGFERGVKGSTAEHLTVLEYKIQQDKKQVSALEEAVHSRKNDLKKLTKGLKAAEEVQASVRELDEKGKKTLFGKVELPQKDFDEMKALAKEAITNRHEISRLRQQTGQLKGQLENLSGRFDDLYWGTKTYREAAAIQPDRVAALFSDIFKEQRAEREAHRQERTFTIEYEMR